MKLQIVLAVATALTACLVPLDVTIEGEGGTAIHGSGHVVTQSWTVADFNAVAARGIGRVFIDRTGREALTVTGEDNILADFTAEVRNGRLEIGPRAGVSYQLKKDLIIRVEVKNLTHVEASGALSIEADVGWLESLFVTLSGACTMEAVGTADRLELIASGVSIFRGGDLRSRAAVVSTSGVSSAVVWSTETLDANASGTSSIRYVGSPILHVSVSGLASVRPY